LAFYPTYADHVAKNSVACRRQALMWRPLGLHEFLQNVSLPHIGVAIGHFLAFSPISTSRRMASERVTSWAKALRFARAVTSSNGKKVSSIPAMAGSVKMRNTLFGIEDFRRRLTLVAVISAAGAYRPVASVAGGWGRNGIATDQR
jgi:hypothetical protein